MASLVRSSVSCSLCGMGRLDHPCTVPSVAPIFARWPDRTSPAGSGTALRSGGGGGGGAAGGGATAGGGGGAPPHAPTKSARERAGRNEIVAAKAARVAEVRIGRISIREPLFQSSAAAAAEVTGHPLLPHPLRPMPADRLNPAQHAAVEHGDGPLLVLAGAGSGKTRVITHRIVRLLERGVPAAAIVALTFTNKAAAEMRERVSKMLGKKASATARALTVSTFHSFGLGVLQRERAAIGGTFTIFDQGDQTSLVKQLLRAAGADRSYDAQAVIARISNAKNAFQSAADMADRAGDDYDEIAKEIYPRYQAALRSFKAFDFDDLVCEVARLWRDDEAMRVRWQDKYLHVLVDEYQDTNRAQLELLRLLGGARRNVCVVGDDDQAIYGWRGADVRNILDFETHFPGARIVKLEHNYRSKAPILDGRQRGHREARRRQVAQGAVHRPAGGCTANRRRGAHAGDRGRVGGPRGAPGDPGGRQEAARHCGALSLQRAVEAHRGGAARAGRGAPGGRGHAVLRAQRGQGRPGLPQARDEPERRDRPAAHHQLAGARHRRHVARAAGPGRRAAALDAVAGGAKGRRHRRASEHRARRVQGAGNGDREGAARAARRTACAERGRPRARRGCRSAGGRVGRVAHDRRVGQALGERRGSDRDARAARDTGGGQGGQRPRRTVFVSAHTHHGPRVRQRRHRRHGHAVDAPRQQGPRVRPGLPHRLRGGLPAAPAHPRRPRDRRRRGSDRRTSRRSGASSTSASRAPASGSSCLERAIA